MAWKLRARGALNTVSSGNVSPSDIGNENDLIVAFGSYRGNAAFTEPSGWTMVAQESGGNTQVNSTLSTGSTFLAYIKRGASAPSLTFTRSGGDVAQVNLCAYYNDSAGTPTYRAADGNTVTGTESTDVSTGTFSISNGDLVVGVASIPRTDSLPFGQDITEGFLALLDTATSTSDPSTSGFRLRHYQGTSTGADNTNVVFDAVASSSNTDVVSVINFLDGGEACFPSLCAATFYLSTSTDVSTSLTGHSIALSHGNESVTGAATVTLGGQIVSFGHGNETVSVIANVNVAVTGTLIGSSVGSVQTGNSVTTTISGTALSASLGNETVSASALVMPSGLLISSSTGSVTIAISRVWPITGQNLTTLLGGLSVTASGTVTFFVSGSAISAGIGNTAVSSDAATQVTPAVLSIISGYSSVSSGVIALLTGFIIESDVSGASVDVEVIDYLPEGGPGGELYDPSVMPVITAYEAGVAPGAELYTANQPPGSDGYTSTAQPSVSAYTPA